MRPDVTEHLALQQVATQAGAAYRHKRPGRPSAPAVDPPGKNALSRAALAPDQDDRVAGGHAPGLLEDPGELRIRAFQDRLRHLAADLLLEIRDAPVQLAKLLRALQHRTDLCWSEGLGQKIESASAHRLHRAVNAAMGRDDHHGQVGPFPERLLHEVQSRFHPQTQIHQQCVVGVPLELRQGRGPVGRLRGFVAHGFEGDLQGLADVRLVIDDQDAHGKGTTAGERVRVHPIVAHRRQRWEFRPRPEGRSLVRS